MIGSLASITHPRCRPPTSLSCSRLVLLLIVVSAVGCKGKPRVDKDDGAQGVARSYLGEVQSRMRRGEPTATKCAGARAAAGLLETGDPLRREIIALCSHDAPLASAKASLGRAEDARDGGRSGAADCAEASLCIEDLSPHAAEPDVVAVVARHHRVCD